MNKEVKFSRFLGIAIVVICIWMVTLALMSAMLKNQNNDNLIYVDEGSGETLSIPKSNIISNNIDIQKEITTEQGKVEFKVKLPKINIETDVVSGINDKIYAVYQQAYREILKNTNIQKIYIDYVYEYLNNDSVIEITVITEKRINNTYEEVENKFNYDLKNDKEVTK